jgi:phosphoglycolate phosphatase
MGHVRRRLIAFDLDGTLIDSLRDLAESTNHLIEELGGRIVPEADLARMIGEGAAVLVRRALAAAGLGDVPGALARFREIYEGRLLVHTRPYPGIPEALRFASQRARLAVLTNKPTMPSERILEGLELRGFFDAVIGGDGGFPRKPEPASLLALMDRAGVGASDTMLVGDSLIDLETARRAMVQCCLASWGFGFESFPTDRLTGADVVLRDADELRQTVERFSG